MAGKNDFAELKKFGTKELKFKQGVHIHAAHHTAPFGTAILSAPVYNQVKQGACVALTLEWLKSQLTDGGYNTFNPAPMPAAKNVMHQMAVWHAAQFQMAYRAERKTKGRLDCLTKIGGEYGLKIADDKELEGDTELVLTAADMKCDIGQGVYFSVGITAKNGSRYRHAVGITRKNDGTRFFDSNVGAYRITDKLHFYERWIALLEAKLGWTVGNCFGFHVGNDADVMPPTTRV